MNILSIILSFIPFLFIFALISPVFLLICKILKKFDIYVLLIALTISPLILSALLYGLFFVFPGQIKLFYILFLSVFSVFSLLSSLPYLKSIRSLIQENICHVLDGVKSKSLIVKFLLGSIVIISILFFVRAVLWPVNWDDQIFYIQQSYIFSELRSLSLYENWGFFRNSVLIMQMNPAIRPGLPMIFTQSFLFSNNLYLAQYFCQSVIIYYFLVFCGTIYYIVHKYSQNDKNESALIAIFLTVTTYLFGSHLISGFKEIILIVLTLLSVNIIADSKQYRNAYIILGILFGFMSFVNYSGVIIGVILMIIYLFSSKRRLVETGLEALKMSGIMLVASCFEVVVFMKFLLQGLRTTNPSLIQMASIPGNGGVSVIDTVNSTSGILATTVKDALPAQTELNNYGINSIIDLYTKGKFQGLFQLQFYGLIFILLLIIIVFLFRNILKNQITKIILAFLIGYVLIIFDPFCLNNSAYAYVMSVSYKYTVLLVPFAALIIATQWQLIRNVIDKIKPKHILILGFIYLVIDLLFIRSHMSRVFSLIALIMPVNNDSSYYIKYLQFGDLLFRGFVLGSLIIMGFLYVKKKKNLDNFWLTNNISSILFLIIFFLLPFCFFFNTNFGFKETILNTFSPKSEKLMKIHGWEANYGIVNKINSFSKNEKILFYDQQLNNMEIHLEFPKENIYTNADLKNKELSASDLKELGITYIFAAIDSKIDGAFMQDSSSLELISQEKNNTFYKVISSN